MIKKRIGVFETNSSSTHTCVIGTRDEFDNWIEGKYVYACDFYKFIKGNSKEEYLHNDFVDVRALYDIPVVEFVDLKHNRKEKPKGYTKCTVGEFWDIYKENIDDPDNIIVKDPRMKQMVEFFIGENPEGWEWRDFFSYEIGISAYEDIFDGELEEEETTAIIDGKEIIAHCKHGWD